MQRCRDGGLRGRSPCQPKLSPTPCCPSSLPLPCGVLKSPRKAHQQACLGGGHGLRAESATKAPGPADAVPLPQRYSPVVDAGSDVVFRWTIDDKQSLTFHNVVFNVIYQSAAVFKLSVGGLTSGGRGGLGRAALTFAFSSALLPRTPRLAAGECGGFCLLPCGLHPTRGSPRTAPCLCS